MNILLAPNSFKECADSVTVSNLFYKYLSPYYSITTKPISDGGDGFLNVCKFYFDLEIIEYEVSTPYDDSTFKCDVGLDRINKILYVESADILGLKVIPKEKRHPIFLSSKGLGDLIVSVKNDVEKGKYDINKLIIGIGGTGTIDMGLGICSRFGMKLFDMFGKQVEIIPGNFYKAVSIEWTKTDLPFNLQTIIDVNNSLLGQYGAIRTFGKQKGSSSGEIEVIELSFNKLIKLFQNSGLLDSLSNLPGAGGGIPAGLKIFFGCGIKKADSFIKDDLGIQKLPGKIDAVITGEGSFDSQSLSGKGAGIILEIFKEKNIPIFLCCGKIDRSLELGNNIHPIELEEYFSSREETINRFEESIKFASEEISKNLQG